MRRSWALCAALLAGCDGGLPEDVAAVARREGFAYASAVRAARGGDGEALKALFRFASKTEGGAGYGHGVALCEVCLDFGDVPAAAVARGLSDAEKTVTRLVLSMGPHYSSDPRVKDVELEKLFPALLAALQGRR